MTRRQLTILFVLFGLALALGLLSSLSGDESAYIQALEQQRKGKDLQFRNKAYQEGSPIPTELRPQFTGLVYYPADPTWRKEATLHITSSPDSGWRAGQPVYRPTAGTISFEHEGETHTLTLFWDVEGDATRLFLAFRDATSGGKTYPGGRFIDLKRTSAEATTVVLDFNQAYNPYCAYSEEYLCPVPPPENRLPMPVQAGEQAFPLPPKKGSSKA